LEGLLGMQRFLGGILKISYKKVFSEKYEIFRAQTKHASLFLKLFSESYLYFLKNIDAFSMNNR
jgi:hypothetical protein